MTAYNDPNTGALADRRNPIKAGQGWSTEHMAAIIVFGALLFLILVSRGFRGVSAGGAGVRIG
jgi:hypothetical protein